MISLFLAAAVGSSLLCRDILPTVSAIGEGPTFSASSTNTTTSFNTNGLVGTFYSFTGASYGPQYRITLPTNYSILGFDNFTTEVADFLNGQTYYKTNGVFRYRVQYAGTDGVVRACSSSINIIPVSSSFSTFTFSSFSNGTLGNLLMTNLTAMTNAGRDGVVWDSISSTGWTWHTNSILFGKTGYTGLSQMSSFGGGFPWKWTAITRRHAYSAGHVFGGNTTNGYVYFVGSDGATNRMFVSDCRAKNQFSSLGQDDYCIVFFTSDLPATVTPLRVCINTNVFAKFPYGKHIFSAPILETCQHGRIGSQSTYLFDNHQMHIGGDSGNPALFLAGNEAINFGGTSGTLLNTTNFWFDMNQMTLNAGLSTNTYQPTFYTDITNYPAYYP